MEGRRSVETKLKFDTISIGRRVGKRSKGIHPRQLYPPITHVSPIATHIRPVDPLCVPRLFVPAIKPEQTSSSPGSEGHRQVNPPASLQISSPRCGMKTQEANGGASEAAKLRCRCLNARFIRGASP